MYPTFTHDVHFATTLPSEPDEREEFLTPLQQKRRMFLGPIINGGPEGLKLLGRRTLQVIGVIVYPVRLVRERRDCTAPSVVAVADLTLHPSRCTRPCLGCCTGRGREHSGLHPLHGQWEGEFEQEFPSQSSPNQCATPQMLL